MRGVILWNRLLFVIPCPSRPLMVLNLFRLLHLRHPWSLMLQESVRIANAISRRLCYVSPLFQVTVSSRLIWYLEPHYSRCYTFCLHFFSSPRQIDLDQSHRTFSWSRSMLNFNFAGSPWSPAPRPKLAEARRPCSRQDPTERQQVWTEGCLSGQSLRTSRASTLWNGIGGLQAMAVAMAVALASYPTQRALKIGSL